MKYSRGIEANMKQRNILFIKGINQYGVLSYMLDSMAEELANRGYNVQIYEWNEMEQVKDKKWDVCISCQAIDMTFDVNADKYVTWLVDHPVLFEQRLMKLRHMNNLWIACVDQTHVRFLREVMEYHNVFYLPHFGGMSGCEKKYYDREINVFFPASYVDIEMFEKDNSDWRTGAVKVISDQVINELKENNHICIEHAIKNVLRRIGEKVDREFLTECMEVFGSYVDSYISKYYRNQIVKCLLDEDISLTVVGRNWKSFEERYQYGDKLNILSENMTYNEVLECMGNSKMVLNVFPWFKDGSHERVTSALLNGAVCLSDQNEYTKRFLNNEVSAILYDRNEPKHLAKKIKYYLQHEDEANNIAERGQLIAKNNMTVKSNIDILFTNLELNNATDK